ATVEEDFDHIAEGKESWVKMITDFYRGFHPLVEKSNKASRQEAAQARKLGIDPKSKKPVFARFGRYGEVLQLGDSANEDEKLTFAPLPTDTTIDTVTLEQALE